jgi:hypothetical protein
MTMAVFMAAFPVLPGKEDDARKLAEETRGRIDEFGASQKRLGITKEEWALQQTPMGSLMLVRFECRDPEAALAEFGQSQTAFDLWSKGRIQEVSGVDMSAPSDDPPPEIVLDWTA